MRRLKIAEGLQIVKYSLVQYPKNPQVGPNWRAKRGTLSDFSTSILSQNIKTLKGGLFGEVFSEKSLTMPKKLKGDPLVSSGIVCYPEEEQL